MGKTSHEGREGGNATCHSCSHLASEKVFAFLDDMHVICAPHRVFEVHRILDGELQNHTQISLHHGKTQMWNKAGSQKLREW